MKAVLISTQPKWCELIASGKKTVEVRKTKPKLETPFKVYIYATKPRHYFKISKHMAATNENLYLSNGIVKMSDGFEYWADGLKATYLNGKVIGEFVCDEIYDITPHFDTPTFPNQYICGWEYGKEFDCLPFEELTSYLNGKKGYGYHISDLVIYDEPKELSEFYQKCKSYDKDEWENDDCLECENPCGNGGKLYLKRPPQSWCYVEYGGE